MGWALRRVPETDHVTFEPLEPSAPVAEAEVIWAAFGSDGRRWVALRRDEETQRWRLRIGTVDGPEQDVPEVMTQGMIAPALSVDGRWLGWGNWLRRDAHVLDLLETNARPVNFPVESSATVAFSPDNRWFVVCGGADATFFEVGSWQRVHTVLRVPAGALAISAAFTSDSRMCALTLPPNQVQLVDAKTGTELITLQTPERHLFGSLAFCPGDQLLAVVSADHHVLLWDLPKLRGKLGELGLDSSEPASAAAR